ncbi:hypothetical protein DFH09DRAFT_1372743 [Mycena vulgaris]|nr:hypothetical protein DFH09DRAFT_1372743 [Mycena vulgaris]
MIDRRWWAAFPGLTSAHYSILNSSCPDDSATLPRAYQRQCSPLDATMDWYCSALAVVSLSKGRPRTPWLRTRLRSHRLPAAPRIPPRPHALLLCGVHPAAPTHPPVPLRLLPAGLRSYSLLSRPPRRTVPAAHTSRRRPRTHPVRSRPHVLRQHPPVENGDQDDDEERAHFASPPPRLVPRDASRRCSWPIRKNLAARTTRQFLAPRPLCVPHHPQRLETLPRARPLLPPPARSHPSAHPRLLVPSVNEDETTCPCAVPVSVPFLSPLSLSFPSVDEAKSHAELQTTRLLSRPPPSPRRPRKSLHPRHARRCPFPDRAAEDDPAQRRRPTPAHRYRHRRIGIAKKSS